MFEVHSHFCLSMKRWDYLMAKMVRNPPVMRETWVQSWVGKIPWRWAWQPTPVFLPGRIPMDRGAWQATIHRVTKNWT